MKPTNPTPMPNDAELRNKVYDMLCPFIMKWCGDYGPHLIDTDGNDGEMLRQDLEDLIHAEVEAELKGFSEEIKNIPGKEDGFLKHVSIGMLFGEDIDRTLAERLEGKGEV